MKSLINPINLEFQKVSFTYYDKPIKEVLRNVSFKVCGGEIVSIIGKNGAGKTTLLNIISGFIIPTSGKIKFNSSNNEGLFSSIVPQEYSLLDWKSVEKNIEFSLLFMAKPQEYKQEIIEKTLNLLKIKEYRKTLPKQLSGGIKQRVAIARALAPDPKVLLLDEPFNSLDIQTKNELIQDIRKIIVKTDKSAILVTHNLEEAIKLSDRILILDDIGKNIKATIKIYVDSKISEIKKNVENLLRS